MEVFWMKDQERTVAEAMRLANTDAGKQLLALLKSQQPGALETAMNQAQAGNYDAIKQTMSAALSSPEVQRLLKQMRG